MRPRLGAAGGAVTATFSRFWLGRAFVLGARRFGQRGRDLGEEGAAANAGVVEQGPNVAARLAMFRQADVIRARDIMARFPGRCDVAIVIETFDEKNPSLKQTVMFKPGGNMKVSADPTLARELQELLGPGNVRFVSMQKKRASGNGAPQRAPSYTSAN